MRLHSPFSGSALWIGLVLVSIATNGIGQSIPPQKKITWNGNSSDGEFLIPWSKPTVIHRYSANDPMDPGKDFGLLLTSLDVTLKIAPIRNPIGQRLVDFRTVVFRFGVQKVVLPSSGGPAIPEGDVSFVETEVFTTDKAEFPLPSVGFWQANTGQLTTALSDLPIEAKAILTRKSTDGYEIRLMVYFVTDAGGFSLADFVYKPFTINNCDLRESQWLAAIEEFLPHWQRITKALNDHQDLIDKTELRVAEMEALLPPPFEVAFEKQAILGSTDVVLQERVPLDWTSGLDTGVKVLKTYKDLTEINKMFPLAPFDYASTVKTGNFVVRGQSLYDTTVRLYNFNEETTELQVVKSPLGLSVILEIASPADTPPKKLIKALTLGSKIGMEIRNRIDAIPLSEVEKKRQEWERHVRGPSLDAIAATRAGIERVKARKAKLVQKRAKGLQLWVTAIEEDSKLCEDRRSFVRQYLILGAALYTLFS